jgi:hypothetical protein
MSPPAFAGTRPSWSVSLILLGLAVGAIGTQNEGEEWITSAARNCVQSGTQTCGSFITAGCLPGLGLMLAPLNIRSLVSHDHHRRMFEKGPHLIDRRDPPYFAKCLDFSTRSIGAMLEASVAYNARDIQPMKNTDDFRLVTRVKGKDGEWWSGGGESNHRFIKKTSRTCIVGKPRNKESLDAPRKLFSRFSCSYSISTKKMMLWHIDVK